MNKTLTAFLIIGFLSIASCRKSGTPPRLEGAWLGEGMFSAGAGELPVKAQLEILSDGSYRFLILEPALLTLAGVESGKWNKEGAQVTLLPINEKSGGASDRSSGFARLRQSSPENLRVKVLAIAADLSLLELGDGPMRITFKPNPKATRELEDAGEVD